MVAPRKLFITGTGHNGTTANCDQAGRFLPSNFSGTQKNVTVQYCAVVFEPERAIWWWCTATGVACMASIMHC